MPDMDSRSESGTEVQEEERINDNHYRDDEPEEKPSPRLGPQDHRKENSSDDTTQDIEKASPAESQDYEVKWEENDPHNPKNMNTIRKWVVVLIVSASSLCVTCASSIYTSTYAQLESEFHVYQIVATLGLSLFVFGLGLGPMLAAPLSEFYGRRIIYIISLALFVVWLIPCAVAQNIQTMLVARFINGFIGASFLSVAGGTVGDMFDRKHLSAPMMVFTASPFLGPEVGPIMGGFINYYTTWRWSFYVEIIWSSVMLALIVLFVPETYSPVLLRRRAQRLRAQTRDERWKAPIEKMKRTVSMTVLRSLYRPFLLLVFEPMVLNLCLLSALLLGIVYLSFGAFTLIFQTNYGFNLWQTGVSFLGLFVGLVIGISTDPLWQKNYHRLVKRDGGPQPEHRLPPTIAGAIICPIGLFWFAWTTYASVHWIVPIIGSTVFGIGVILIFSGVFTFLVESYPLYAASALGANSLMRSLFAGAFPLFGVQMYKHLGFQWASTLLALLAVAMAPFPYIFFKYGKRIRKTSRYASAN